MSYDLIGIGYTIGGECGKSGPRPEAYPATPCEYGEYPRTDGMSDERRADTRQGREGRRDTGGLATTKGGIRERAHRSTHRVAPLFSALRCADMQRAWTSSIVGYGRDRNTGPSPTVLSEP